MVGRELGAYRVGSRIGRGGIGEVYEATHARTGRQYAIKILLEADEDAVRRFRREGEALAAIGHPGVVAIHDFDQTDDGLTYLVMDKLEGEDLGARLERGPMALATAMARFAEAGAALAAAHHAGVLHRDLKPSNIFLTTDGSRGERAMLLDFGLAKSVDDQHTRLTATGQTMGTPLYMSPEQALGETLDVRSDVYSLAAVLYEMLCGEPPFDGPTITAILSKVLTVAPPTLAMRGVQVPSNVESAVLRALSKARADRPAGVAEFVSEVTDGRVMLPPTRVFPAVVSAEGTIPPTRATPRAVRPANNSRAFVLAASLAGLLLAVVIGGWVVWQNQQDGPLEAVSLPPNPVTETVAETALLVPEPSDSPPSSIELAPSEPGDDEPADDPDVRVGSEAQSVSTRRRAERSGTGPAPSAPTPLAPAMPRVPPGVAARNNAAIDQTIVAARARIAGYEEEIPVFEQVSRMSIEQLCGASYLRGVPNAIAERVRPRVESSREHLCTLQAEVFPTPPDVERSLAHLRGSFERHRRSLAGRRAEVLPDAERRELLDRIAAVEAISGQDPYPCEHPAHARLHAYARELGPVAAQPGLEIGRSVDRICSKTRRIPSALARVRDAASRAVGSTRTNITAQQDVIRQLERSRL